MGSALPPLVAQLLRSGGRRTKALLVVAFSPNFSVASVHLPLPRGGGRRSTHRPITTSFATSHVPHTCLYHTSTPSSSTSVPTSPLAPDAAGVREPRLLRVVKNSKKPPSADVPLPEAALISRRLACEKYLLTEAQLKNLANIRKRSSFLGEPEEVHYLDSDCRDASLQLLGPKKFADRMRTYERLVDAQDGDTEMEWKFRSKERRADLLGIPWYQTPSGKVVRWAIGMNLMDCLLKAAAAYLTGSKSMFAESVHALVDTSNQIILALGLHQSLKKPDKTHPYGYASLRYVTSLISGVGILGVGCGMNIYHGIFALINPSQPESLGFAFVALGCSFVFQSSSATVAYLSVCKRAAEANTTPWQYVTTGKDPSLNVVLLEDSASVVGVGLASLSVLGTYYLASPIPDALGSIAIGALLGVVAYSIIKGNTAHLVGQSIPQGEIAKIITQITEDPAVSVHDVKATILGPEKHRFKAEIDFNGKNITRSYLEEIDLEEMLQEVRRIETPDELRAFMTSRGDRIIDRLGIEVDRIEKDIKIEVPIVIEPIDYWRRLLWAAVAALVFAACCALAFFVARMKHPTQVYEVHAAENAGAAGTSFGADGAPPRHYATDGGAQKDRGEMQLRLNADDDEGGRTASSRTFPIASSPPGSPTSIIVNDDGFRSKRY